MSENIAITITIETNTTAVNEENKISSTSKDTIHDDLIKKA